MSILFALTTIGGAWVIITAWAKIIAHITKDT